MLRRRLAAISATLAVVAVACGGTTEVAGDAGATAPSASSTTDTSGPDATAAPTSPDATAPATSTGDGPAANAEALTFTAQAVGGGTVDGVDYAGGDVVLWIWAPW